MAIYNHAVAHTTAIWNDVVADLENRAPGGAGVSMPGSRCWWRSTRYSVGYASYGPFRAFGRLPAHAEHSVYVAEAARRRGVAERAARGT
jgi:phosphinothricin acetyltransferase